MHLEMEWDAVGGMGVGEIKREEVESSISVLAKLGL